jgi:hypothetical protein
MSGETLLVADLSDGARLFACVATAAHHVTPEIGPSRLSAYLHPFASEDVARRALADAGGSNVRREGK